MKTLFSFHFSSFHTSPITIWVCWTGHRSHDQKGKPWLFCLCTNRHSITRVGSSEGWVRRKYLFKNCLEFPQLANLLSSIILFWMSVPFVCTHCICDQRQEKFCLTFVRFHRAWNADRQCAVCNEMTGLTRQMQFCQRNWSRKADFWQFLFYLNWGVGPAVQLRGVVQERDHAMLDCSDCHQWQCQQCHQWLIVGAAALGCCYRHSDTFLSW